MQPHDITAPKDDGRLLRRRALHESLLIGLAGLLAVGAGALGLWIFSTSAIRENYRHHLVTIAQAAAAMPRTASRPSTDSARSIELTLRERP